MLTRRTPNFAQKYEIREAADGTRLLVKREPTTEPLTPPAPTGPRIHVWPTGTISYSTGPAATVTNRRGNKDILEGRQRATEGDEEESSSDSDPCTQETDSDSDSDSDYDCDSESDPEEMAEDLLPPFREWKKQIGKKKRMELEAFIGRMFRYIKKDHLKVAYDILDQCWSPTYPIDEILKQHCSDFNRILLDFMDRMGLFYGYNFEITNNDGRSRIVSLVVDEHHKASSVFVSE